MIEPDLSRVISSAACIRTSEYEWTELPPLPAKPKPQTVQPEPRNCTAEELAKQLDARVEQLLANPALFDRVTREAREQHQAKIAARRAKKLLRKAA
jgi:hypothetical protein